MRTLTTWEDLQQLLTVSEAADLDFKRTINTKDPLALLETAKDIAALANTLGGHLVVGADDDGVRCTGFPGITVAEATAIKQHLEQAAGAGRCLPTPFITVQRPIEVPGQAVQVLVARIEMAPIAPIGVNLCQRQGGKFVVHGWCFPYRVGSQTNFLTPDQFGAYESMSARRAAALLNSIPETEKNQLQLCWEQRQAKDNENSVALRAVLLHQNVATFRFNRTQTEVNIPLDDVLTVWLDGTTWIVALAGSVSSTLRTYFPALSRSGR